MTATAACLGERPVAKAFGTGVSMIGDLGFGRSAIAHRRSTMSCSAGASSRVTTFAPEAREGELVGGVVLEERQPDDDQQHRDEPDAQDVEQDDGEDDVQQAKQATGQEHARREACITAIGAAFHGSHGTGSGGLDSAAVRRLAPALAARCSSRLSAPRAGVPGGEVTTATPATP